MGTEFKDFYKVLGVDPSASQEEIKKAFRTLARTHHPDVNKAVGSETRFKDVSEAYDVLGDMEKRAEYDQLYAHWKRGGIFPGQSDHADGSGFGFQHDGTSMDLEGLFQNLFGNQTGNGRRDGAWFTTFGSHGGTRMGGGPPPFAEPSAHDVEITLEEAYTGCKRQFESILPDGGRKVIKATIPAGVTEGRIIHLEDKRNNVLDSMDDLFLRIRIRPHARFQLEGRDVHLELPVTPWEAALGTTVTVPTLGGPVRLKIPAGCQSGKKLALNGRGLPGTPPGTQYITLTVFVPAPTTEEQRELYRRMKETMPFDPREEMVH